MNKQNLKTLVVVSVTAASVFFVYRLYKTVKKVKQDLAEQEALKADIKPTVAAVEVERLPAVKVGEKPVEDDFEDLEPIPDDMSEEEWVNMQYARADYEMTEEMFEKYELEDDDSDDDDSDGGYIFSEPGTPADESDDYEEEVEELRFPPNSKEALEQYINMTLAEFQKGEEAFLIFRRLYNHKYRPKNQRDMVIYDYLVQDRMSFFGPDSVHNTEVSFAELLLYFAKYCDFDLDGGVNSWGRQFLYNLDLRSNMGEIALDRTIKDVLRHSFVGHNGYGIFGLSDEEYRHILSEVSNSTVNYMTFSAQYNTFLRR